MKRSAFSLVEMLVVIGIITLLGAILLPVFWTVRGKGRQASCSSNLHQIGTAVGMYVQDYDGRFPRAVDPSDRLWPSTWDGNSPFQSEIPNLPYLQQVLLPYTASKPLFSCPADTGFDLTDFTGLSLQAFPTSYEKFGSSYYYRTEVIATDLIESSITNPTAVNLVFDGAGAWHGTLLPKQRRYNVEFVDGHVKNISDDQMQDAWNTPLTAH